MSAEDPTVAEVTEIPPCDFPHPTPEPATVDGKTTMGPWAYMCASCHVRHGMGLGLGKGQRLVLVK